MRPHLDHRKLENRAEQIELRVTNGELRRMNANRKSTGAAGDVVTR